MATKIEKACSFLITHAQPRYSKELCGKCATMIRTAVDFGFGIHITRVNSAKHYGPSYEKIGFKKIFSFPKEEKHLYTPQIGDICIIQYEPHGHICMLTQNGWISDFVQRDMYGGKIRDKNPPFDIYRLIF